MDICSKLEYQSNGGIIVIGETVVTLHQETAHKIWETVGYGIPSLTADDENIILTIMSIETGEIQYKISIENSENYHVLEKHFHVIVSSSFTNYSDQGMYTSGETSFGLNFAHVKVAEKFYQTALQLMPSQMNSVKIENKAESPKNTSTICCTEEMTDYSRRGSLRSFYQMEEAGALTASGKFLKSFEESVEDEQSLHVLQVSYGATSDEDGVEDVDGRRLSLKVKNKTKVNKKVSKEWMGFSERLSQEYEPSIRKRSESMDGIHISYPTNVKHLAHVNACTPFHALKEVVNTGVHPLKKVQKGTLNKSHLYRTPSAPGPLRHSSLPPSSKSFPAILVTPVIPATSKQEIPVRKFPTAPPISDFEDLLRQLHLSKEDKNELTNSTEAWQLTFYAAVSNLIHKKLANEPLYSKLLSFTQSGNEEVNEKSNIRTASVIIHDHGVVSL